MRAKLRKKYILKIIIEQKFIEIFFHRKQNLWKFIYNYFIKRFHLKKSSLIKNFNRKKCVYQKTVGSIFHLPEL